MKHWSLQLQYPFWSNTFRKWTYVVFPELKENFINSMVAWKCIKHTMLPDQYYEDMHDFLGMYCAGGEL